jgi:hypothetical protein
VLLSDLATAALQRACELPRTDLSAFDISRLSWAAVVLGQPELAEPLVYSLTRKEVEQMGKGTAIFAPFLYNQKTIILPRQARDKHKENSQELAFP